MDRKWMTFLPALMLMLLCTAFQADSARILGIFPTPSFSHQIVFQTIMKALVARGHQVTVISTDPLKVRLQCKYFV
jgi:glucuronosyltransferase